MQTDTVIGIVGAVVLVSVMVGVFAYEYNNPDSTDGPDDEQLMATFAESYPDLAATDDMDGDGVPNYLDDDMDGDGIDDADDTSLETVQAIEGSVSSGPLGNTDMTHTFAAVQGAMGFHVALSYGVAGTPADSSTSTVNIAVTGPDGAVGGASTCTFSGSTATCEVSSQDALAAGDYTVTVSHNGVAGTLPLSQTIGYTGDITVHY